MPHLSSPPSAAPTSAHDAAGALPLPFMDTLEVQAICTALRQFSEPAAALEWGSGSSTLFFPTFLAKGSTWHALEHDPSWAFKVEHYLTQVHDGARRQLVYIPPNRPFQDGRDDGTFEAFRDYVTAPADLGAPYDVILVDGRARAACMQHGWELLAETGLMVLHDANRPEYHAGIPDDASTLWMRNPQVDKGEGPIALLFLSKSAAVLDRIEHDLSATLPAHIDLQRRALRHRTPVPGRSDQPSRPTSRPGPTCVFLNTYYGAFLQDHYTRNTKRSSTSYAEQHAALQATRFGDSDFYSHGLQQAGWHAVDLIVNCMPLQQTWGREHGLDGNPLEILLAQLADLQPDVVYLQDLSLATPDVLQALRQHTTLIAGQIASPVPEDADLHGLDLIFSSFPHFVERFRAEGLTACYQPLAFDPRVLDDLSTIDERPHAVTFVGGLSPVHTGRLEVLEAVARQVPLAVWGYGAEKLPAASLLRQRHHGPVWGRSMFEVLTQSALTLNVHIDVAENHANNMRLFEATGCGALLITDYKDNLNDLFRIGEEVVAYRTPEECAALVDYYQNHPEEARAIAAAGQARTLRDHTYAQRMQQTAEILARHLRYHREPHPAVDLRRVSSEQTPLAAEAIDPALTTGWQSPEIPAQQRALVQQELAAMYSGEPPPVYTVLAEILRPHVCSGDRLLELGCASGYYYEVLEYLLNQRIAYTGVDYSEPLIAMARDYYPNATFVAADGAALPFDDGAFDLTVSSGLLLHVPNWREHIAETVRIAAGPIVAHRTPLCRSRPTQHLQKRAYGVPTVELRFNEDAFLAAWADHGYRLTQSVVYHSNPARDEYEATLLFTRISNPA